MEKEARSSPQEKEKKDESQKVCISRFTSFCFEQFTDSHSSK